MRGLPGPSNYLRSHEDDRRLLGVVGGQPTIRLCKGTEGESCPAADQLRTFGRGLGLATNSLQWRTEVARGAVRALKLL